MITIRVMEIKDYDGVYDLWINTPGMGLNATDDSKEGIAKKLVDNAMDALDKEGINKVGLVVFERNEIGNGFWEKIGFAVRDDLVYRNKNINELSEIRISEV